MEKEALQKGFAEGSALSQARTVPRRMIKFKEGNK